MCLPRFRGSVISPFINTKDAPASTVRNISMIDGSNVKGEHDKTLSEVFRHNVSWKEMMFGKIDEFGTETDFGSPVVPDVVKMYARSWGVRNGGTFTSL
jgi:hypothetical protein